MILVGAWFIDKIILVPTLIIAFRLVRVKIEKNKFFVWHIATIFGCMLTSSAICILSLYMALPIHVSLVSNIINGMLFAMLTWYIQDNIDSKAKIDKLNREIDSLLHKIETLTNVDIYKMNDDELRQFGASKGLTDLQQDILVLKVIENYKIVDIMAERNYSRNNINYHLTQIKQKLEIKI